MSDETYVDAAGRVRTRKTHCKHGHLFPADAKLKTNWKGYSCRVCLECDKIRMREYRKDPAFQAAGAIKTAKWRKNNPERYKESYTAQFEKKRQILLDARAGGCIKCEEKDAACLDFHHRDPSTKEGQIGEFRKFGVKHLLAEIAKCDVLCANCHRKHHRDEREAV